MDGFPGDKGLDGDLGPPGLRGEQGQKGEPGELPPGSIIAGRKGIKGNALKQIFMWYLRLSHVRNCACGTNLFIDTTSGKNKAQPSAPKCSITISI